jgi:transcriptional regulator GlxA family with amidase domain
LIEETGVDWRVRTAIDDMLRDIDRPLAVTELARRVNLSRSRLTHLFHTELGCSPARYLRQARLDRARQLVEETSLSIKEIMARVGFNDPSHFSRDFSKRHGASPRRIRARARSPGPRETGPLLLSSTPIRLRTVETANDYPVVAGTGDSILL